MATAANHELKALILDTLKTYALFLVVALIAMGITSAMAWLLSWVGIDMWPRVVSVADGLGSPGAIYVIFSSWIVLAAVYFAFPHQVHGIFGLATKTLADVWFSVLGALSGFSLAVGLVIGQWGSFILILVFTLVSYGAIVLVNKGLNPANFSLGQRLIMSLVILLLVPLALVLL